VRHRIAAGIVACAALLGPAATAADAHPTRGQMDAVREYLKQRVGVVGVGVVDSEGRVRGIHGRRRFVTASVIKAMLLVTYLRRAGVRDRALTAGDRALLAPMIRRSDNVAATRVRDIVGDTALHRLARRAGMTRFATNPVWGLSRITARDQTRLWLRFESFLPPRHRDAAMELLRTIVPRQRWGFGRLAYPPGWELFFKGGWGSGTGLVEHQVALLRRGTERVAVAILTTGSPSHAYGKQTLRGVAERLLHGLP
jgi:hypothetical protein